MGKKGEGIKGKKTPHRQTTVWRLPEGKGVEGGRKGHKGEYMVMEGDMTWVMNTKYNIQMIYHRIVHLKPI